MMLAEKGVNVPFAYNRKEAKDHGEGGVLVGAPLKGRGADYRRCDFRRHFRARIGAADSGRNAVPAGVVIALDRMEKGTGELERRTGSGAAIRPAGGGDCQSERFVYPLQNHERIERLSQAGARAYGARYGRGLIRLSDGPVFQITTPAYRPSETAYNLLHSSSKLSKASRLCPYAPARTAKPSCGVNDAQLNIAQGFVVCSQC